MPNCQLNRPPVVLCRWSYITNSRPAVGWLVSREIPCQPGHGSSNSSKAGLAARELVNKTTVGCWLATPHRQQVTKRQSVLPSLAHLPPSAPRPSPCSVHEATGQEPQATRAPLCMSSMLHHRICSPCPALPVGGESKRRSLEPSEAEAPGCGGEWRGDSSYSWHAAMRILAVSWRWLATCNAGGPHYFSRTWLRLRCAGISCFLVVSPALDSIPCCLSRPPRSLPLSLTLNPFPCLARVAAEEAK